MATRRKLVVSVSGDRPIREVQKDLADAGFVVDQVLDAVGSIVGSAEPGIIKRLRAVRGVADVEASPDINIGKPDDPETW